MVVKYGMSVVSGVRGEGFLVLIFERMILEVGLKQIKKSLLYVPDAGTNLLGRDLFIRLGLDLGVEEGQIKVIMGLSLHGSGKEIGVTDYPIHNKTIRGNT